MTEQTWASLALADPLYAALDNAGFTTPSPIQARAIGPQMEGRDLLGLAQTGSGKTAAFLLPILQELTETKSRPQPKTTRALILVPTRELAVQIEETAKLLSGKMRISTQLVLGGMSRPAQIRALGHGVDILIATPGRLTDLFQAGFVRFDTTQILVLDEADRMLDMGFARQVQSLARSLHRDRRTALFSATMPKEVTSLAEGLLRDPVRVEVARSGETAPKIEQSVELIGQTEKRSRLASLLSTPELTRAIVFTRTKRGADRVTANLAKDGIDAGAIHGNKSQNARQRVLNAFKAGQLRVLVASDIAARGIDVQAISHVVQYDMPDEPEAYVHRIGRTGRAGAAGIAIAFCSPDERDKLRAVERLTKQRLAPEGAGDDVPRGRPQPKRSNGDGPRGQAKPRVGTAPGNPDAAKRRRRPRRRAAA